ncbi:MAG TPA: VWA domain-containing protein [Phycisphaerae bacterium]|nr:VWA domain-containing protein [Phycisphaerae bacterium]
MNVDFRCEHCGKLLSVQGKTGDEIRCPHCMKMTAVPAGLASLPRPRVGPAAAPGAPPQGPEQLEEVPHESDVVLGVMAKLMPFVISVFFHLGLALVILFMGTMLIVGDQIGEVPVPDTVLTDNPSGVMTPQERTSLSDRRRTNKLTRATARESTIPADNARPGQAIFGIGPAVGGTGTGWFASGGGLGTSFFGTPGLAHHIVYVVDRSGSMLQTFDAVRNEMLSSIGRLDPNQQDFHVILFNEGPPLESSDRRLVPATPQYKAKAAAFLSSTEAQRQTNPVPALSRAFEVLAKADPRRKGKIIYLLTDAVFPDNERVLNVVRARNANGEVHINTFLYGDRPKEAEEVMQKIARENKGAYKFISAEE